MVVKPEDRRGWAVMLYPSGVVDVFGAVRGSSRLHWTPRAAREEAQDWIEEMRIGPISWESIDDQIMIGRTRTHCVVIRSILLPLGEPPPAVVGTADLACPPSAPHER